MPALARKILICAAVDGLVLQPLSSRKDQRAAAPVKLRYGDATISSAPRNDATPDASKPNNVASFESFGVVGVITVSPHSYLISITRRQQVASVRGQPIYVVTEVALTPCTSQTEAAEAVTRTAAHLKQGRDSPGGDDGASSDSDSDDDDAVVPAVIGDDDVGETDDARGVKPPGTGTVVEDVISKRGSYGRFAKRWFSRDGWLLEQKRSMGLSADSSESSSAGSASALPGSSAAAAGDEGRENIDSVAQGAPAATAAGLLPKLLRTAQILFGTSRSFFFSYDYDITRSVAVQGGGSQAEQPLFRRVQSVFFWNKHVQQRFIDAGADAFVLPLMQGFVGQRSFVVDSHPPQTDDGAKDSVELSNFSHTKPGLSPGPASPQSDRPSGEFTMVRPSERRFDITVISRRSVKRAGLRYLRRGVDDDGNTANFVETEQILSPTGAPASGDASAPTYSFVQIRGSIPLFFTQSPYSLKPAPVIQHSLESNYEALKKHFDKLRAHYGSLQIVNLVEKHGIEAPLGEQFERGVKRLNEESAPEENIPFDWFDFHAACRGMKFENVSLLLDILGNKIESLGSTVASDGGDLVARQKGVLRTNCMDCLDRTNVCQSSFAKLMLELQLREQGIDLAAQHDQETSWFNTLWADNGDAISKQYASTAAMKGDYTRTKKRDYRGALTDMGLSVTRFFSGMINDFFVQTAIDFLLGNVTSLALEEFEVNMMTKDPAVSMQKLREQAIELCQKRVVADEREEFIGGWTMLTSQDQSAESLTAQPFEEAVLLLTDVALYLCRFDWNLDKVSSFERVELSHVRRIKFGTYITATMTPTQVDSSKNQGILITYRPGSNDVVRVNTRSMSSVMSASSLPSSPSAVSSSKPDQTISPPEKRTAPSGLAGIFLPRRGAASAPAPAEKRIALKALYSQSSLAEPGGGGPGGGLTEVQQVVSVSAQLERLVILNQPVSAGTQRGEILEHGDIVSLAEAKRSTGLLEQLGHSIKRLVWA